MGGLAVHARGGQRAHYPRVRTVAGLPIESGNAVALAHVYATCLGLIELYAADLDAIQGGPPQDQIVSALTALGTPLWLDEGVSSVEGARHALDLGAARVVVGLETLASFDALSSVCDAVGGDRVAFSLDLREGRPVVAATAIPGVAHVPAHVLAGRAADAGVGSVIVIDLARVGGVAGPDVGLMARVREAVPGLTLFAGGGVRGLDDLVQLADAGCDGALVASALHDGSLAATDVAVARELPGRPL